MSNLLTIPSLLSQLTGRLGAGQVLAQTVNLNSRRNPPASHSLFSLLGLL